MIEAPTQITMTRKSVLCSVSLFGALLVAAPPSVASPQTERRTLAGDRVSIYNLAGRLRVQPGSGSQVVVDVTRVGHDAAKLKLATGDVHGFQSLRVVYPSDRVVYPEAEHRTRTQ